MMPRRPLRAVATPEDLPRILAAIAAGSGYAGAAIAAGVRPSALRRLRRADPAVARSLRQAWREFSRKIPPVSTRPE